jgi:hypothetical protein
MAHRQTGDLCQLRIDGRCWDSRKYYPQPGPPDITVLLATAQRLERKEWPKNFFVAPYLPGQEAARNAQLMLFNGGSGSAYQPLSCGKPVIGFPTNMTNFYVFP